jgi:hypothetical protein
MSRRFALFAAFAVVSVAASPVHADPFKPIQAQKVELGALTGVAYYTLEPEGHRLVLTLQAPESGAAFRVVATLAPGQAVTLSVPSSVGEPAVDVHFARDDAQISMNGNGAMAHLEPPTH